MASSDLTHSSARLICRRDRHSLAAVAFVDSLGDGLYLAGSALFFTRGLGLPVGQTGLGLTIAGVIGLLLGTEMGRVADRRGPRRIFITLMLLQTAAVGAYVLVHNLAELVTCATVAGLCRQGAQASRGAMIAQLAGSEAAALRSYLHAVINVGIAGGAALAGIAVARDTHTAYDLLMLADAATFTLAAVIALRLPSPPPTLPSPVPASEGGRRWIALADRRFVALTTLSGVLSLQFVISGFLLPLWVSLHTAAPRWSASPLLLLNTAMVAALQVRTSRRFVGVAGAAKAYRAAGFTLAAACALFAAAAAPASRPVAVLLLVAAMVIASLAELITLAGAFGLSFGLAPAHAVGEYQGVWNLGFGTSMALGPGLLTLLILDHGALGWCVVAAAVSTGGLLIHRLATDPTARSNGLFKEI